MKFIKLPCLLCANLICTEISIDIAEPDIYREFKYQEGL